MNKKLIPVLVVAMAVAVTGCSNKKLLKQHEQQIVDLQSEVQELSGQLDSEKQRTAELNGELARALSDLRTRESVWIEEREALTRITLDGDVAFRSGSARLSDDGRAILKRIFDVLANYPDRDVLVEGHTDNVQIAERWQERFRSNWELSSARAHSVLHHVVKQLNADPRRVAAVGYGEYRPVTSNDTEEGRAMNRRVVITVGPRTAVKALP